MQDKLNNFRYYFFSFIYDLTIGVFYKNLVKHLIEEVNMQQGKHILEVGIGTGITIPFYDKSKYVTGIDISEAMLKKAGKKASRNPVLDLKLRQVSAECTDIDINNFDLVVFSSTLSVLHNPKEIFQRYYEQLKDGGSIFILNHFTPESGILNLLDRLLLPIGNVLGFKSFFPLNYLVNPAIINVKTLKQGYWRIIQIRKPAEL